MANIQEEVTNQAWEMMLRFLGTGTEFVCQLTREGNVFMKNATDIAKESLVALINRQKEKKLPTDATARMLARVEKGEGVKTTLLPDEHAPELIDLFKKNEVLFNVIENPSDDTKVFMYMSGDSEKVAQIISLWQAEKGLISEINPNTFLDYFVKEGVGTLSGLDQVDLELFRGYAHKNGLLFSSVASEEKGKHIIVYNPKDAALVRSTMASVAWALSGDDGERFRERMVIFARNRQQINRSFGNAEKEFYIVSGKDPKHYIHLTAKDFKYYKKTKEVLEVNRSAKDFLERGLRIVDGFSQPVILSKEEFELVKTDGELDEDVLKRIVAAKAETIPDFDLIKEDQKKRNEKLERIQEKMALDEEGTAGHWIYDDSIDFASGSSYETLEDIDDQTKADMQAARNRARNYQFHEVDALDNRSIDYYIAEAEKHRKNPEYETEREERDR